MTTIWQDTNGRRVDPAEYVHKQRGRWIVAVWSERAAQYHAPMTAEGRALTGAHTVTSRTVAGLSRATTYHYAARAAAVRRAAQVWGWKREEQSP